MAKRLSIKGFLGAVAGVALAAAGLSLALPHDPYIRYQSFEGTIFKRLTWVYERLAFDDTPIDVLVVGSSRSARGANVPLIEAALADRGVDLRVANISEPAAGMDIRVTKIREALSHHPEIKLIVLGVVEALPRDGHQAFGDLGTAREVLTSRWAINRNLPGNLARLPYRQMELALATALPEGFGYRGDFDPGAYPGPAPDHRLFEDPGWTTAAELALVSTPEHAAAVKAESERRNRQIRPPILPASLGWAEFGVSRDAIEEIASLAEEAGAQVAFLHLPFYGGHPAPMDADWLARHGPVWAMEDLRHDTRNYADAAHASQIGVDLIAPWLADRIVTHQEEHGQ